MGNQYIGNVRRDARSTCTYMYVVQTTTDYRVAPLPRGGSEPQTSIPLNTHFCGLLLLPCTSACAHNRCYYPHPVVCTDEMPP
jgi:hypothetical protein